MVYVNNGDDMKIKDITIDERPRERLIKYGASNLSNTELLAIIIGSGTKNNSSKDIANNILNKIDINKLKDINYNSLKQIDGLGNVKKILLLAIIELGKRIYLYPNNKNIEVYKDAKTIFLNNKHLFIDKKQEYFYCLYLDNQNKLIERKLLFIGTINQSIVHPREIFKEAYLLSASKIICLHNHPSNNVTPSKEDYHLTKNLIAIGKIQGIYILDHIIIGFDKYYSFFDNTDLFTI